MRKDTLLLLAAFLLSQASSCGKEAERCRYCGRTVCICDKQEQTDDPASEEETVNLATYNVGVFNKSGVNSMKDVAAMMKEWDLDALSLNELDSCNTRSGANVYQLKNFASEMGDWNYSYARAISHKGGSYGIGSVTPEKILHRWSIKLPKSDDKETRALNVIETEKFVFCNTHLGLTAQSQMDQIGEINAFVAEHFPTCSKPVFLCGDMNALPGSESISELKKDWDLISTTGTPTFSTSNPSKCIDYIFRYKTSGKCTVRECRVGKKFENGNPLTASDHFPVLVRVVLVP